MCDLDTRAWYLIIASFWLLITVARQVFDLIGKLWIPVAFNLIQILSCITGLFAGAQWRMSLLIIVAWLNVVSAIYNLFIFLWYNNYFGDREQALLSAGLPFSYRWVQLPCTLPYYRIEAAQAAMHFLFAVVLTILAMMLIKQHKKRLKKAAANRKRTQINSSIKRTNIPTVATQQVTNQQKNCYLNSLCESAEAELEAVHRIEQRPCNGYIRQGFSKQPPRRKHRLAVQSMANGDQQGGSEVVNTKNKMNHDGRRSDSHHHHISASITTPYTFHSNESMNKSRFDHRAGSIKSFKLPATDAVRRILSREDLCGGSLVNLDGYRGGQPTKNHHTSLVSFDPKSNTLIRVQEHIDDDNFEVATLPVRCAGTTMNHASLIDQDSMRSRVRAFNNSSSRMFHNQRPDPSWVSEVNDPISNRKVSTNDDVNVREDPKVSVKQNGNIQRAQNDRLNFVPTDLRHFASVHHGGDNRSSADLPAAINDNSLLV